MKIQALFFYLFLFSIFSLTNTALAQDNAGHSFTVGDTVLANRLLEEGEKLMNERKFEAALIKFDSSELIYLQIKGKESLERAKILSAKGRLFMNQVDFPRAISNNQEALQIRLKILGESHNDVCESYIQLGSGYQELDEFELSIQSFEMAFEISIKLFGEENEKQATILNNMAIVYDKKGEYIKSIPYYEKALLINLKIWGAEHTRVADNYLNLGNALLDINDYERAMEYYENALRIRLKIYGEESLPVALVYNNIGYGYTVKEENTLARQYIDKALQIQLKVLGNNHPDVATSYINLGFSYLSTDEYDAAIQYLEKALQSWIQILGEKNSTIAECYYLLSVPYRGKEDYTQSIFYLQKALEANKFEPKNIAKTFDLPILNSTLNKLVLNYLAQYKAKHDIQYLLQAKEMCIQAFEVINFQQKGIAETDLKEFFIQKNQPFYENAILTNQLLYKNTKAVSYFQEGFTLAERSKSFLLYGALQESNALQFSGLPADLLQQEYDLRVDITYNEKRRQELMSQGVSETDTTVLAISGKLFDLKQSYETLKKQFETEYPEYYCLKYDLSTISAIEVQRELLQPNQAMLEYFVGDSSLFVFVVRPDTLVMQEVKKDFPLEDWVKSLRESIYENRTTGAMAYTEAAYNLYQKLIAPVKSLLPEQLIIIPDGILGYVPFEALLTAKPERAIRFNTHPYLLKQHQISYCYSATLLREMQQKKRAKEPTETLLAVAPFYTGDTTLLAGLFAYDETTRKDLAPLQNSGEEVYRISRLWKGDVLTGAAATEAAFTERAGNYRILHLATHGRADERVGDYSFLAFSEIKDSVENELLYVRDLYNLQLNADLVVLSACETGLGKLSRGEGIISLARAFAYAGAKSIVTTLWSVDDAKTKDLMVDFYRKLKKGMTKDAALRQAKLDYLESHKNPGDAHPFYWAGFAPIGDMRPLR